MTAPAPPRLWTIPPSAAFLPAFADALIAGRLVPPAPEGRRFALEEHLVLLPTRRACRTFAELLAERVGGATLLPRIRPIGDVDEVDLALFGEGTFGGGAALDLPPAIPPLQRHLLLATMVLAWGRSVAQTLLVPGREEPVAIPVVPGDAALLARDLARLIDDFETEGVSFRALEELVPEDHAAYWALTVGFLRIVSEEWPRLLEERGASDPATRRNALLRAEAARLAHCPPTGPIIAAGSTGTIPATAALLAVIARLPHGAVVLPGLDLDLDEEAWTAIDAASAPHPGHPQYGLKRLLGRLGAVRASVEPLVAAPRPARDRLVGEAFRPAATTEQWASLDRRLGDGLLDAAVSGIGVLEAADEAEEALAIAIALRETVATPGRTAALVTPDRGLARRVAAELARWQITVDDSAGVPLAETPAGGLFRQIVETVARRLEPVALVALIQHPLARFGLDTAAARRAARWLELAVLRGPRPAPGCDGLIRVATERLLRSADRFDHPAVRRLDTADRDAAFDLATRISAALEPLERLRDSPPVPLAKVVASHAEALSRVIAGEADELPSGEDVTALDAFLEELLASAGDGPDVTLAEYPALLAALMAGRAVRPVRAGHPRLAILGPLEARLLSADLIVLGGLDEGVWPADTRTDPFLNRPMRGVIGLEAPERFIGLAAHDVAQALGAPEVLLARAMKIGGAPTVASRWLRRLAAVVGSKRYARMCEAGNRLKGFARRLDLAEAAPRAMAEPAPCPPLELRPTRISVTEVETLIRDPYSIYARRILGLEPLPGLDEAPDASSRGEILHDALARFVHRTEAGETPDLIAIGRELFARLDDFPEVKAIWWPRFLRVAEWFAAIDAEDRRVKARRIVETGGALELDIAGRRMTLTGRADRIDVRPDGTLRIVDYKTGSVPSPPQVLSGLSPQLPLEAAIAMRGGFDGVEPGLVATELVYIELKGSRRAGSILPIAPNDTTVAAFAEETLNRLIGLLHRFCDPGQPYHVKPRAQFLKRFNDYDHLSRWPEWAVAGGGEE
ncbi:ATP-dependent helicase/nuclease subunit B [Tepidamorphus gemmatus]|uniref:ATP-dependent helicase/nuclease subunit B n=1 Tax=Tepidamorphus gemmatus TaxID=747076 RepID=A0A4V6NZQ0_9HYPH|nr:double-strand break repair protein AddB [Tepidamorphus gemmatus]TCT10678.1 ATP-dependent helicase/nuclease subunit B [Tepidamorphus gemmatus]